MTRGRPCGAGTCHGARLACAAFLLAGGGLSDAAPAQTPGDTAALAHAVAHVIGDSLLTPARTRAPMLLGVPTTDFDRAVTMRLMDAHGLTLMPLQPDTAEWVVTRGVEVSGDTAAMLVEVGTTAKARPRHRQLIDTYIETNRYLFLRTASGWRFVRREFVRGADLGAVRG